MRYLRNSHNDGCGTGGRRRTRIRWSERQQRLDVGRRPGTMCCAQTATPSRPNGATGAAPRCIWLRVVRFVVGIRLGVGSPAPNHGDLWHEGKRQL